MLDNEVVEAAQADTSSATENAAEETAQVVPTESTTDSGVQAEPTPPADKKFDEFDKMVDKAIGEPKKPAAETEVEEAAPEKTDEQDADKDAAKDADVLSQDKKDEVVPERLTERPEWKSLTAIADKLGKAAGKETRKVLREIYKREYDLTQTVEKSKPAVEVVQEMFQSVGGSEQGFANMRQLIKSFDSDPQGAVPMLETLLNDAKKRAGMVLQSPELLSEAQQLDQQVKDGLIEPDAAEKRKKELLELEQARMGQTRTKAQTEAQRQAQANAEQQRKTQIASTEINQAEESWTADKLKNDPDFSVVQNSFNAFAKVYALEFWNKGLGMPNAKQSVEILEKALKTAKDEAGKFRPKPTAKKPVLSGGSGSSGNNRQQPTTELERFDAIVERAIARHS
jgi:hypothetical protein